MKRIEQLTTLQIDIVAQRPKLKMVMFLGIIKWILFLVTIPLIIVGVSSTVSAVALTLLASNAVVWGIQTYYCALYRSPFDNSKFETQLFLSVLLPIPFGEVAMVIYELNQMNKLWNDKGYN